MNKPDGEMPPPAEDPPVDRRDAEAQPRKASAMRLPEGVQPARPQGPQSHRRWDSRHGGRPQQDAERRAGKSRKVH